MKSVLIAISFASSMLLQAGEEPEKNFGNANFSIGGIESSKTVKKIKEGLPFARDWKRFDWQGNKLLVGLSVFPSYGVSKIDLHGYIYNQNFKEWRRFCAVKTRNAGCVEVGLDENTRELYLLAKANTQMKGKRVFSYSLLLLSDDRGYLPKAEPNGVDQPATSSEWKLEERKPPEPKLDGRSR